MLVALRVPDDSMPERRAANTATCTAQHSGNKHGMPIRLTGHQTTMRLTHHWLTALLYTLMLVPAYLLNTLSNKDQSLMMIVLHVQYQMAHLRAPAVLLPVLCLAPAALLLPAHAPTPHPQALTLQPPQSCAVQQTACETHLLTHSAVAGKCLHLYCRCCPAAAAAAAALLVAAGRPLPAAAAAAEVCLARLAAAAVDHPGS